MQQKFIAEIGSNHNNNLIRIEKLIYTAKDLGFWAVKFQLFRAETLYWSGAVESYHNAIKNELDLDLIYHIKDICDDCEIKLIFTPFDNNAIDFLSKRKLTDLFKISSFDILRKDFILKAYDALPGMLFISTGLANYADIEEIIEYLSKYRNINSTDNLKICLMHCVSKYPTKVKESNIYEINILKHLFNVFIEKIGYSDHTVNIEAVKAAICCGAEYIELHYDLNDKKGNEYKYKHCWTENKVKKLFNILKNKINIKNDVEIFKKFGTNKRLTKEELGMRADPSDGLRPMLYKRVKETL